jgi:threonine aldolase
MALVRRVADEWSLPVHLDGARIFNAAISLGVHVEDIARYTDSVMFCVSKGLCAPVGSLLAGPADFIAEARYKRKIMGGGMRQAGILAAAGILALTEMPARLAEDHHRAKTLAAGLADIPGVNVSVDNTDIDMVFFHCYGDTDAAFAQRAVAFFAARGIRINPPDADGFRFVTHAGIEDADIDATLAASRDFFGGEATNSSN